MLLLVSCAPAVAVTPSPVPTEPSPVASVAVVESIEIQTLESFPVQVNAVIRGNLPDAGCTTIKSVDQVRDGNTFRITLVTTTDPLALCAQALTPFEQVIPLDVKDLPPGTYIVNANGVEESFDLPAQNALPFDQTLVDALSTRNYESLRSLMNEPFMIGYWQSEGTSLTREEALELFQTSLLSSASPVLADHEKDLVALLGVDPVTIIGPQVVEPSALLTTGWGPEGKDEAILFLAKRPDGSSYWYGLLFAKDGFVPSGNGSNPSATGYQPVDVDHIAVEVGVGSPIPVQVIVSGNLPDTCAQIELVRQRQEGSNFHMIISTIPSSAEGCIQDTLPFRITIPLNIVNVPAGAYTLEVNGVGADFTLETGNTTSSLPTVDSVITKDEVRVDDINVQVGVGSPIPVHAVVSLSLPNTCAQLGEIRLHREETTFYIRLIAEIAERADCKEDSIPFRAEIPLNMVNLPDGQYIINVNGAEKPNEKKWIKPDPLLFL
jgi:hypothetical protein